MACSTRRRVPWLAIGLLVVSACGEDDPGPGSGGTDGGRDGSVRIDGSAMDGAHEDAGGRDSGPSPIDGATPEDGSVPDDTGSPVDAGPCELLSCPPPEARCHYERASCTSCGELVCGDVHTPCVECPLLGDCCSYDGASCDDCGDPVCFTVDCAAPPPGCHYEGSSCRSCGELVCNDDAGPGGVPCGPVTCGEGLVCCNASCGICTPPRGTCIEIACEDAGVPERRCGARLGDTCARTEYCDFPPGALCGAADGTGVCRTRPDACTAVFMPVCGCDGATHSNACEAHAAGTDDARDGSCGGDPEPPECAAVLCMEGTLCTVCVGPAGREPRCLRPGEACERPSP